MEGIEGGRESVKEGRRDENGCRASCSAQNRFPSGWIAIKMHPKTHVPKVSIQNLDVSVDDL